MQLNDHQVAGIMQTAAPHLVELIEQAEHRLSVLEKRYETIHDVWDAEVSANLAWLRNDLKALGDYAEALASRVA